jgi:hypothetical protein
VTLIVRFYIDPETDLPHIYRHEVSESEAEEVLERPAEDRPGTDGTRVALGQTIGGRFLRVIYVSDPEQRIRNHGLRFTRERTTGLPAAAPKETTMKQSKFPPGWDAARVQNIIRQYETQTDFEAVAEDEAAFQAPGQTTMEVPNDLVPAVRELIAKRKVS